MKVRLPKEIAAEIGCSAVMLRKINQGSRRPSPELARKIITAMGLRGEVVSFADLRPDLADLFQQAPKPCASSSLIDNP